MPCLSRFSRHDRTATAVIAALLLCFLAAELSDGKEEEALPPTARQVEEMRAFAARESAKPEAGGREESAGKRGFLSPFDPNTADSARLARLGLPPRAASNITKYRRAGGVFRKPEDLKRIYGMTEEDFKRVAPYVRIKREERPAFPAGERRGSGKLQAGEKADLNCGDTAQLKRVPGVGSVLAARIVKYGRLLGGYVSPAQVNEVYGIPPGTDAWFSVSGAAPRKLNLNTAAFGEMLRHPYLTRPQVQAVMRFRRTLGAIPGMAALRFDSAFTERDSARLAPYVEF